MPAFRRERRLVPFLLLLSMLAPRGCVGPEPRGTDAATSEDQRRERLRDQLRSSLGARYDAPLPDGTNEEIRRGSRLYDQLCQACHGRTGKGNGRSARMLTIRPPDLTDPSTASFFSDQAKLKIIAEGLDKTPMIGWSGMLEEKDRIAVLHFMNTLIREPQSP